VNPSVVASWTEPVSYAVGVFSVLIYLWIASATLHGRNLWSVVRGIDGRLSTSKFQFFLWTGIVVFTFATYQTARVLNGHFEPFDDFSTLPTHVLWAMGLATGTSFVATGIAASSDASGKTTNVPMAPTDPDNGLVAGDDGMPDLAKIQMLTWTAIAVVAYLASVFHGLADFAVCPGSCAFPDISATLLSLMGIGQVGYLGNKLTQTDPPRITGIAPQSSVSGRSVTITGQRFGNAPGTISANNMQLSLPDLAWTDTQIRFTFPPNTPNGTAWPSDVRITVVVGNTAAANPQDVSP
jgi:hypothetical protein